MSGEPIDVGDMYPVHNAFRDTLAGAPRLVSSVPDADAARRDLIANFYRNVIAFLHVHHGGEEDLVFPLLRQRCLDQLALVEEIAGQHRDVDELVGQSVQLLDAWSSGDLLAAEPLARTLAELGQCMEVHLEDEETKLLPLCATNLTAPEWGALPGHAMGAFEGDKIWLILGLIRDRMDEEQRARMLARMPPPAVEMWTSFGEQSYVDLMEAVGPLTA